MHYTERPRFAGGAPSCVAVSARQTEAVAKILGELWQRLKCRGGLQSNTTETAVVDKPAEEADDHGHGRHHGHAH